MSDSKDIVELLREEGDYSEDGLLLTLTQYRIERHRAADEIEKLREDLSKASMSKEFWTGVGIEQAVKEERKRCAKEVKKLAKKMLKGFDDV